MQVIPSTFDSDASVADWRAGLPVLSGERLRLRELKPSDAAPLMKLLTSREITRFITAPPTTLEGFSRFIDWTRRQRAAGSHAGFAVTLPASDTPIGIFQVTDIDADLENAEWGFVIGAPFWGTGLFQEGARLLLDFVFNAVGVRRLEARAAVLNGRGNGALLKLGAVQEGILRKSFLRYGRAFDQVLYSILDDDWRAARPARPRQPSRRVH